MIEVVLKGKQRLYMMEFDLGDYPMRSIFPTFNCKPQVFANGKDITDEVSDELHNYYLILTNHILEDLPDGDKEFYNNINTKIWLYKLGDLENYSAEFDYEFRFELDVNEEEFDPSNLTLIKSDEEEYPMFGSLYLANKIYYNYPSNLIQAENDIDLYTDEDKYGYTLFEQFEEMTDECESLNRY